MPLPKRFRSFIRALLLVTVTAGSGGAPADCPSAPRTAETVVVRHVHDGDTLILEDERKLRLLGYNSPEIARRERPGEPLGAEARERVAQWIEEGGRRIRLQYDAEHKDRYGRVLAHAFLGDGRNIAELMLQAGLAASLIIPPNLQYAGCYAAAERRARAQRLGVWELPSHQPADLKRLATHRNRYTVLRARVLELEQNTAGFVLWLGSYELERVRVFIAAEDLELFPRRRFKTLTGREIEVRGWLHKRNKTWTMQLRHPVSLDIP
jgi:micrococcal nuclease